MGRLLKFLMSRVVIVAALILAQLVLIALAVLVFSEYFALYYAFTMLLGIAAVCSILSKRDNPSYKIAWIILILVSPPFGVAVYTIFKGNKLSERIRRRMIGIDNAMSTVTPAHCEKAAESIEDGDARRQSDYIRKVASCPPYRDTDAE